MNLKKLSITLLSTLSVISLCSCNKGDNSGKIEISIGFWPQNTDKKDVAMYEDWKKAFEADNPEYLITADPYIYSPDTVITKARAKTLPTVFQTWFTEPATLVENKYIRDCDDELKSLSWIDKMDEEMKKTLTFDGKVYGVPRDGYGIGLLINKRILGDCDLLPKINGKYSLFNEDGTPAYPTSFEQIYEYSKVITEYDDAKGCLILTANKNGGWQFTNFAWNFGAEIEKLNPETNKWEADLTSKGCVDALSWIQKMKQEGLLLDSNTVYYDDWYSKIGSQVAMAFVGSDVLQNAKLKGNIEMDDLAFVEMPTGDGVHHYSLYGGTPFVFPSYASDKQVEGALKFLEYVGRSPLSSDISRQAMIKGNEVAKEKSQPILPTIKPWINKDYLDMANEIEKQYITVDMDDYEIFFDNIQKNKHSEEPYFAQELYKELDLCIQQVMLKPDTANVNSILLTAQSNFNKNYMSKVK